MSIFGIAKKGFGKAVKAYKKTKIKIGKATREERIKYGERSPDIKSVKPTKDIKGSVERGKSHEYLRRIKKLDKAEEKVATGKKMMQEGQRARKQMKDTGTAFQFKHSKTYHPIQPGDKQKYKIDKKGISRGS
jgi:hypothetical protein